MGRGTELLARGAIFLSCVDFLEEFISLHRDRRSVVLAACLELRFAAVQAAAMATTSDEAVRLTVGLWSEQLERLASMIGLATDEAQLLGDLRRASASATAEDAFALIFERVVGRAQALYDVAWPPVEFIVRTFSDSFQPERRYPVRAATEPATDRTPITVALKLDPLDLLPDAFAAIPGLLIHECVCHVASHPEGQVDNLSAFAEGFMDWAATYYRKLWLADFGSLGQPAEEHARGVFDDIARSAPHADVVRRFGRQVAGRLAECLMHWHGMSPGAAAATTANYAVRLNVYEELLVTKDKAVRAIHKQRFGPLPPKMLQAVVGLRDPLDLL